MRFNSIMHHFVFWFVLVCLLPILLISYSLMHTFSTELEQTVVTQISFIADKKMDQINNFLDEHIQDLLLKTKGNTVPAALHEFSHEFKYSGTASPAFRKLDGRYHDYFKRFIEGTGYYDVFLISPQGDVVYSYKHAADFASNLFSGPYRDTGLARVTRNVVATQSYNVSDFERYAPANNAIVSFMAVPVITQNRLTGILAVQISNVHMNEVLLDVTGLGMSGETVIARKLDADTALVLASLKSKPDAALNFTINLRDPQRSAALVKALNGERGSGYTIDYNGIKIVSAWRYLARLKLGMVVKMDSDEALAPLHRVLKIGLFALLLSLAAAVYAARMLARRVVVPLRNLNHSAQQIAEGKFVQNLPADRSDELGQLAASFNTMAQQLQASYAVLEEKVAERTAELKASMASLQVKEAAIASSISAMAIAGLDGKISYVNQAFVDMWQLSRAEDAIGRSSLEFWERPETTKGAISALESLGYWRGELRARRNDGSLADIELSANLVKDEEGRPVCMMASFVNTSARKLAEQELQRSQALLETLLREMPAMVFVKRASDLSFEMLNRTGELWLGYTEQEMLGKTDFDFFPPDQAVYFSRKDREVLNNHLLLDIDNESILTRNGDTRILHTRKIGIYDEAGKPTHMLGVSIDITEQNQLQAALRSGSKKMHEAQRIAKVGSWELNLLTGELSWSDEIFRQFEIDKSRFGPTYDAFLQAIHPDDKDMVHRSYTASLQDRKPYLVIHRLLMSDGRIKWIEQRCESEFAEDGTPLQSRGTVQDITAQKLTEDALRTSETRYHSVVAALSEGIVLSARDGSIIAANEAAEKMLGLSRAQMMGLKPLDTGWRTVHENGTDFLAEEHPAVVTLRTGLPQTNVIMGVHKRAAELTWISINSQPVFQPDEALPSSVVASYVDVTESKNAENMLKKTNEELERRVELRTSLLRMAKEEAEQANKSKSIFLTSMSHELRTPLNAIMGYSQLMELDASLPDTVVENATEIKRAGAYLLSLMNDILDLSRIESGKLQLKLESVALSEVLASSLAQNMQAAKARSITLHMEDYCSAYHVYADERALLQVMNNFISNAIKYNREGGRVHVSCSEEQQGKLKISVMDTGLGIQPEKQSQLFQPFNRLGAEMSNIEGTGIGLVISKKLIEDMQGAVGVESVHGLGSTFWLELSVAGQKNSANTDEEISAVRSIAVKRKIPLVLVAEDYAPNQHVLLLQLQAMGCAVDMVKDGAEGLKMWRKKKYDLVLTDIDMPVMNGVDFAQTLRAEERTKGGRIPVVAITATNSESESKRYKSAGIDAVLNKPLSMDGLRKGLTRWLGTMPSIPPQVHAKTTESSVKNGLGNAILDLNYLYQILGQVNLDQARILIDTFIKTAEEGLQSLVMQTENDAVVAKEMHKQKSSAKTVGALRYANQAAALEQKTKLKHFNGIAAALLELRQALDEVKQAAGRLIETPANLHKAEALNSANLSSIVLHSVLVVDDDMVVLQQVKAMLHALGASEVLTAINGVEAIHLLHSRGDAIELLVCDLSMPEMDGVELIRGFGKTGFKGGLILISGADEKIISTVNKLAVLQGLRVLGQLQKPVNAAQLAILLAHTADLPVQQSPSASCPLVSREAIREAIDLNAFSVWFQPKVDASSLRVVGMEALARWQVAGGKYIPPDSFITLAEREGLIGELSQLLVSLALSEAEKVFAAGFPLKIAINLSGSWLNDLSLPDFVYAKTRQAGLRAEDVILEVTETGVMEDLTTALDVLSRLRLKGFGLSIDDFGIGYSSFEQLGRIPFTEMKLDRSFVSTGVKDAAARAILESSMDMAFKLKLSTVAEGVETELDLKLVRSLGCDLLQGYLIAKPMPVRELLSWLANEKSKKRR